MVCCAIIACVVPKFGLFINLVGAFACTALAFVMPVWIYNRLHSETLTNTKRYLHYALVIFGLIAGGIASVVSIYDLVQAFAHQEAVEEK